MNPARDIQPYKNKHTPVPVVVTQPAVEFTRRYISTSLHYCYTLILYSVILVSPPLRTS